MLAAGLLSWVNHQLPTISIPLGYGDHSVGETEVELYQGNQGTESKQADRWFPWYKLTPLVYFSPP